jgi:hypothetical protein
VPVQRYFGTSSVEFDDGYVLVPARKAIDFVEFPAADAVEHLHAHRDLRLGRRAGDCIAECNMEKNVR